MKQNTYWATPVNDPNMGCWSSICVGFGRHFRIFQTLLIVPVLLGGTIFTISCGRDPEDELLIFAAASVIDVLIDTEKEFERLSGTNLIFNFAGSQTLASEIANGAPGDVLISAGPDPVYFLIERGKLDLESVVEITRNRLVVAVDSKGEFNEIYSLSQLNRLDRLSIADPDLAPAGSYAREALTALQLWDKLASKMVYGSDVRSTLAYVQTGNVDAAIVYQTDVRIAKELIAKDLIPDSAYSSIVYPGASLPGSANRRLGRQYLTFLQGESALRSFDKHGFIVDQRQND